MSTLDAKPMPTAERSSTGSMDVADTIEALIPNLMVHNGPDQHEAAR
ncbi:hypothetical protein [Bradyrhizobium sp.]|jgi:hypothetical protein